MADDEQLEAVAEDLDVDGEQSASVTGGIVDPVSDPGPHLKL